MVLRTVAAPVVTPAASAAPTPVPAAPPLPQDTVEKSRPNILVKAGGVLVGAAVGAASVPANALAGGLLGLSRGAGVTDPEAVQRIFKWTFWGSTFGLGMHFLGGPFLGVIGGALALGAGTLCWKLEGDSTHRQMLGGVNRAVKVVTFGQNDNPDNSLAHRVVNGAAGAVAGVTVGAWQGFKNNFLQGRSILVDAFHEASHGVGNLISPKQDKIDLILQDDDYKNIPREDSLKYVGYFTSKQQDTGFPWKVYMDDTANMNFSNRKSISDFEAVDRLEKGQEVLFQQARGIPLGFTAPTLSAASLVPGLPTTGLMGNAIANASQGQGSINAGNVDWDFGAPIRIKSTAELKLLYQMFNPDARIKGDVGDAANLLSYFTSKTLPTSYPWKFYELHSHKIGPVSFNTRQQISALEALRNVLQERPTVFQKKKQHSAQLTVPFIGANFGNMTWYSDSGKGSVVDGMDGEHGLRELSRMENPDKMKDPDPPSPPDPLITGVSGDAIFKALDDKRKAEQPAG
ncbi:MAG: hypothetical protein ACYCW6_13525 [Candidatus Xenobia bacterium]